ncbi:MAG: thiol reductase thioredoxin [Desulfobulbus sp.]|nr:MAG: thiol reductase thioredoxin [Desulfobulbus sp.]
MNSIILRCPSCGAKNRIPPDKGHLRPKCGRCGHNLPNAGTATVVDVDDQGFERLVRESALPILVVFYSPTCGPCRMLAPVIENIARSYAGRLLVAKLDTSRHQSAASRFKIRGVPTLLLFKNGNLVDQIVGAAPQTEIERHIRAVI